MKFWKAVIWTLLMSCLAVIPVGCDEEEDADAADGQYVSLAGSWQLVYKWTGYQSESRPVVIMNDLGGEGTFICDEGGSGTWRYIGSTTVIMTYNGGTIYNGTLENSNTISGVMRNGSDTGTFTMTRL